MANTDSTGNKATFVFEPFSWYDNEKCRSVMLPADPAMRQASDVRDIAGGIHVILEMFEREWLCDGVSDEKRILDDSRMSSLLRLAIAASAKLQDDAESFTDWAEKHHINKG